MEIYTSYYGFIKNLQEYNLISVSRVIPDINIKSELSLAPSYELLNEYKKSKQLKKDEEIYVSKYKEELSKINLKDSLNNIFDKFKFSDSNKFALLCYEKPYDFCHRHILAEEIENKLNIKIKEIGMDYLNYSRIEYKYKLKNTVDLW